MPSRVKGGSSVDKQIGAKLRKARKGSAMSLGAVEKQIGISAQMLCRYESGGDRIRVSTLIRLAKVYGISVNELFP